MYLMIIECEMLVLDYTLSNHSVELISRPTVYIHATLERIKSYDESCSPVMQQKSRLTMQ